MKRCKKTNKEKDDDVNEDEDTEDMDDEYEELDLVTLLTNFFLFTPPTSFMESHFSVTLMYFFAGCK